MKIINSISAFHRLVSLPSPSHPLVSVIKIQDMKFSPDEVWDRFAMDFYCISLKRGVQGKIKYGQQYYDFDKGLMTFTGPRQVQSLESPHPEMLGPEAGTGYALILHPDFLYKHPLAKKISAYGFFSYSVNEALHLSDKEEQDIVGIFSRISEEYQHIDRHTQDVILSQIDLLLNYSNRFYERQFFTRKVAGSDLLTRLEEILAGCFDNNAALKTGVPSVEWLAGQLNLSPHYLSDMLRSLTGQNAQQHIQDKLIETAKQYLATTSLSVAEIAYQLGFEYPQSFNKLFKKKTAISPLTYRQTFH